MPWWSWLLIWGALSLALVGMLALVGVSLFRKALAVMDALSKLGQLAELLDTRGRVIEAERADIAVLLGVREVRRRREQVRTAARARILARHETRIARAKSIIAVDASKRSWFVTPEHNKTR